MRVSWRGSGFTVTMDGKYPVRIKREKCGHWIGQQHTRSCPNGLYYGPCSSATEVVAIACGRAAADAFEALLVNHCGMDDQPTSDCRNNRLRLNRIRTGRRPSKQ